MATGGDVRRDVIIGVRAEGTEETSQEIGTVAQANKDLSDSANQASSALDKFDSKGAATEALERWGVAADGAKIKIEELGSASEKTSQEMISSSNETAEVAVKAAQTESEAYEDVKRAQQEAIDAWRKGTTTTEDSSLKSAAAVRELSESFIAQADAIRASDSSLEAQKAELQAIAKELQNVVTANALAGDAGKEQANIAGDGLAKVKGKLIEVQTQLNEYYAKFREIGETSQDTEEKINNGWLSVSDATETANEALQRVWDSYANNGKITVRQVGNLSQAVEILRLSIVDQFGAIEKATPEAIAEYERLGQELIKVTERARLLNDAQRGTALGLKETGSQFATTGLLVQQLTSHLGGAGSQLGMVAGQAGFMGSMFATAKKEIQGLDLNTLSATGSMTKMGIQAAALAATLYGSVEAGKALAETSEDNVSSLESFEQSAGKLLKTLGLSKGTFGGVQQEIDKFVGSLEVMAEDLDRLDFNSFGQHAKDAALNVAGVGVAARAGKDGVDLFNVALAAGIPIAQASKLAIDENSKVLKFYHDAQTNGAAGMVLWAEAVRNANGDADALTAEVKVLQGEQDRLTETNTKSAAAVAALAGKMDELTRKENDYREDLAKTIALQRVAASDTADQTKAEIELNDAVDGHTKAIDAKVRAIISYIPNSQRESGALKDEANALQTILDKTPGLSAKERERLQVIIELAQKGNELTESDKRYVAELGQHILAGQKAVDSARAQIAAMDGLRGSIANVVAVIEQETAATAAQDTAIGSAVRLAQQQLATNTQLSAEERGRYQLILDTAKGIDALVIKEKAFEEAQAKEKTTTEGLVVAETNLNTQRATATKVIGQQRQATDGASQSFADFAKATTEVNKGQIDFVVHSVDYIKQLRSELKATEDAIASGLSRGLALDALKSKQAQLVTAINDEIKATATATKEGQVYSLWKAEDSKRVQTDIELQKKVLEGLTKQVETTDQVTHSNQALVVTYKDGVPIISNVTKEQSDLANGVSKTNDSVIKASDAFGTLKVQIENGKISITNLSQSAKDATRDIDSFTKGTTALDASTKDAIGILDKHKTAVDSVAASYGKAKGSMHDTLEELVAIEDQAKKTASALNEAAESVDKLAKAGTSDGTATQKFTPRPPS